MLKVMLVGKKGTGKDELARQLMLLHPYVQRASFADAMKRDTADMLNKACARYEIKEGRPIFPTDDIDQINQYRALLRPLWQWYGTDFVRRIDPDYWVRRLALRYTHVSNLVVTDCRFENEAEWGRRNGFVLVRVIGPDRRSLAQEGADDGIRHVSETALAEISTRLEYRNEGTIAQMGEWIDRTLIPGCAEWCF